MGDCHIAADLIFYNFFDIIKFYSICKCFNIFQIEQSSVCCSWSFTGFMI